MLTKTPGLLLSISPVIFLLLQLITNIIVFKDNATSGPNQIALLLSAIYSILIGVFVLKQDYKTVEAKVIKSILIALQACILLLFVGSLIGVWIMAGIVPTMIYYGLQLISAEVFLPVTCFSCALISLSTGSSWSTTGTVGIALMAIGSTMGIPPGLTAGAIISGAYFGDKMSPLSDTTNLAPAVAGTDLSTHIKHMMYTSIPSILIAITIYTILGFFFNSNNASVEQINNVVVLLNQNFNISPLLFIAPAIIFLLVYLRFPAIPALVIGLALGAIFVPTFQYSTYQDLTLVETYKSIMNVAVSGFSMETDNPVINKLLSRGGMAGMLSTIWLILCAMIFGGALETTGMLEKISSTLIKGVTKSATLIGTTIASCLFINLTASDQYLSIVIPGRMFKDTYDKFDLAPQNLSRALEDSGTVLAPLIPWNSGGAYNAGVLGVATLTYAPYAFFNIASPIISTFLAITGWTIIKKVKEVQKANVV